MSLMNSPPTSPIKLKRNRRFQQQNQLSIHQLLDIILDQDVQLNHLLRSTAPVTTHSKQTLLLPNIVSLDDLKSTISDKEILLYHNMNCRIIEFASDKVIKTISNTGNNNSSYRSKLRLLHEGLILYYIKLHSKISNNIIQLDKFINIPHNNIPGLLLPKYDSSLYDYIRKNTSMPLDDKKSIWYKLFNNMLNSLKTLKDLNIIHLDIKTSNVLVDLDKAEFYLTDFSSSFVFQDFTANNNDISLESTIEYLHPNLINHLSAPSHQSDLYSMGLTLLTFITGQEPFHNSMDNEYNNKISRLTYLIEMINKRDPIKYNLQFVTDSSTMEKNWQFEINLIKNNFFNDLYS
ncbi:hypothetical protein TBLA_0F01730 [Henningerozyma blattae CBS 6284]|uniref:Protein kinase domain-containing protein n=1 Tax=Henningerozyma blattae (strain ATCC 34711 / CBS 6284 / DSM 70876 / NBRC 10599 / NRRL Y-10934 / UCD 77-7) TaxID=1071380 RepID=I2H5R3_HENB6|nr:hypothetical protein TBLA_0F01730 [Tetrapisispora blattae CBS 6284]CCH61715.1 hypothetical protein TBLA_0F01730 [Tetrapisispora blattae CBS 6284]